MAQAALGSDPEMFVKLNGEHNFANGRTARGWHDAKL